MRDDAMAEQGVGWRAKLDDMRIARPHYSPARPHPAAPARRVSSNRCPHSSGPWRPPSHVVSHFESAATSAWKVLSPPFLEQNSPK